MSQLVLFYLVVGGFTARALFSLLEPEKGYKPPIALVIATFFVFTAFWPIVWIMYGAYRLNCYLSPNEVREL